MANTPYNLYQFVCQCLLLDKHPELKESIKAQFASGQVDLEHFIHLSSIHFVLPAVFLQLKKAGLLSVLPIEYVEHIEEIYNLNCKRNKEILEQVKQINRVLSMVHIQAVYLKGTANLIDGLYSDIGRRMIGDIDLLVADINYQKTITVIENLGYMPDKKGFYDPSVSKHYYRLFKKDVPADIEVHRMAVIPQYSNRFTSNNIINKSVLVNNNQIPTSEHRLIHNFIHSQLSNRGHWFKYNPLRDLYDFFLLSQETEYKTSLKEVQFKNKFNSYASFCATNFKYGKLLNVKFNFSNKIYTHKSQYFYAHPRIWKINSDFYKFYFYCFSFVPDKIILSIQNGKYRSYIFGRLRKEGVWNLFTKPA